MENKYSVMITVPVMVRIDGLSAVSQQGAIEQALDSIDFHRLFVKNYRDEEPLPDEPTVRYTEFAEGEQIVCALVDECGDSDFGNSRWYKIDDDGSWVMDKSMYAGGDSLPV